MYSESDYISAAKQTRLRLAGGIALIAACLAVVIVFIALEIEWAALVAAGIGFIVCFFVWSFKVMPWLYYNKFLKELRHGQRRQMVCEFKEFSPETRMYDNVEVRDVLVTVGNSEEDERLYVLDADKPLPQIEAGDRITVTSYGSFITDIAPAAGV